MSSSLPNQQPTQGTTSVNFDTFRVMKCHVEQFSKFSKVSLLELNQTCYIRNSSRNCKIPHTTHLLGNIKIYGACLPPPSIVTIPTPPPAFSTPTQHVLFPSDDSLNQSYCYLSRRFLAYFLPIHTTCSASTPSELSSFRRKLSFLYQIHAFSSSNFLLHQLRLCCFHLIVLSSNVILTYYISSPSSSPTRTTCSVSSPAIYTYKIHNQPPLRPTAIYLPTQLC